MIKEQNDLPAEAPSSLTINLDIILTEQKIMLRFIRESDY